MTKTIAITGASAGIGRAIALTLARDGHTLALLARGHEGLAGARREVEAAGGRARVIPTDVANWQAVDSAAEIIEREAGPIDVWVNAAMATVFCPLSETDPADFRRATEVTYLGTVHGTLAALHRMQPRNRGTIVQVGSALAYRGIPLQSAYCGAKFAVRGFTDALQSELRHARSDIKLCTAHIAAFNTPQFDWSRNCTGRRPQPVPPVFQPEVAAEAIAWLIEHPRREMWVGFPAAKAILAARWLPGRWIDAYLARRGYDSQLTSDAEIPGRPDNLYVPIEEDRGRHGRFDAIAKKRSMQAMLTTRRATATVLIAGLTAYALARK